MTRSEACLILWSGLGLSWWAIAWGLAAAARRRPAVPAPAPGGEAPFLSVFKPLPPLGSEDLAEEGLASFIAQLDERSELLLGVDEADAARVAPFVERMRREHPAARLKKVVRPGAAMPADPLSANPKIAWQRLLAREAEGELWLWSDADIVAPPGFLREARAEFARGGAAMVTFPYVVRRLPFPAAVFDALFVNVEFYPGVLLLGRLRAVDFGLGAGMLFRRDDFALRADWGTLGGALADDFALGRVLGPVRLGRATLATVADATGWRGARDRYLRWHKTIRWCRPGGFAAQIVILPVLGWIAAVALAPGSLSAWAGLLVLVLAEVFFADRLCRAAGCRLRPRDLAAACLWSLGRGPVWLSCWFPWPVVWRRQVWHGARLGLPKVGV